MVKKIYSFNYNTNIYTLSITERVIRIDFPEDPVTRVYINRINYIYNVNINPNNALMELMEDGSYLISDGVSLIIDPENYNTKIIFLEDGSNLDIFGDSSILLTNNGNLSFYDNDNDLKLFTTEITNNLFEDYFSDKYSFTVSKSKKIVDGATMTSSFIVENIVPYQDVVIGEYIGVNNKYQILSDNFSLPIQILPLMADTEYNNLSNIF